MGHPVDSAFVKGRLLLQHQAPETVGGAFDASPVSDVLSLLSLVVLILLARRIIEIIPSLLASIIRWKESVNLFNSVRLVRDRNAISVAMVIPFCLIVSRSGLYSPAFMDGMSLDARFGVTTGIFILYLMLRTLLEKICTPKKRSRQMYLCACKASFTFFILLSLVLLALSGLFSVFDTDPQVAKNAMLWVSAGIYAISLLRKTQIFASSCSIFTAFLYLCALEILPTGALVASAVIL